jgi:hypothetical protein
VNELIFIEGLPGSGKSESSRKLAANLSAAGLAVKTFIETDQINPLHTGDLDPEGAAFADVHLRFTPDAFAQQSLEKYQALRHFPFEGALIFESFPIQSHIRVLLQMDAGEECISRFWSNLQDALEPLQPALIFFEESDPEAALRRIIEHRGQRWGEYIVGALQQSPYATARGLRGLEGILQLMSDYNTLMNTLVTTWRFDRLVLEARPSDYANRDRQILTWITNK